MPMRPTAVLLAIHATAALNIGAATTRRAALASAGALAATQVLPAIAEDVVVPKSKIGVTPGGVKYFTKVADNTCSPFNPCTPQAGDIVKIKYKSYLSNGAMYDSSEGPGRKPLAAKFKANPPQLASAAATKPGPSVEQTARAQLPKKNNPRPLSRLSRLSAAGMGGGARGHADGADAHHPGAAVDGVRRQGHQGGDQGRHGGGARQGSQRSRVRVAPLCPLPPQLPIVCLCLATRSFSSRPASGCSLRSRWCRLRCRRRRDRKRTHATPLVPSAGTEGVVAREAVGDGHSSMQLGLGGSRRLYAPRRRGPARPARIGTGRRQKQ